MSPNQKSLSVCLALSLVLFLGIGAAEAQEDTGIGIKGGLTLSELDGSDEDFDFDFGDASIPDIERGKGFSLGLFLEMPLGGGFSLQPEALYQRRVSELQFAADAFPGAEEGEFGTRITYLEVPLLLKYTVGDASVRPVLFFGPSAAITLEAESFREIGEDDETTVDIKDAVSDYDVGATIGAGLEFGSISVEARYIHGLTDIDDTGAPGDLKWRTFLASLGITF